MLLILFTLTLIVLNILFFYKNKYLSFFIPCMLFLPKYYGIELSESLPIITATRIMFIILYVYTIINKRRKISHLIQNLMVLPKHIYFLYGYFLFRLISNLYYFTTYASAIKTFFEIIFEQLLLLLAVYLLAPDESEQLRIIKSIIWTAVVLEIIGIFESLTFIRPFDALYTVSRFMLNDHYVRLGLLRSTATLGIPNFFGNACILVLPLVFFLYEHLHQTRYLVVICITFFAIVHSGCRSDIIFFFAVVLLYFIHTLKCRKCIKLYVKHSICIFVCSIAIICILSFMSDILAFYYKSTAKSVLNSFGFTYDLSKGAPPNIQGYNGLNPAANRIKQLTALLYVAKINPITGLGSGAQNRGDICFHWGDDWTPGHGWYPAYTYDVGLVEVFCDEGIIGLMGVIMILVFILLDAKRKGEYTYYIFPLIYLLTTLSSANLFEYLFTYMIIFSPLISSANNS